MNDNKFNKESQIRLHIGQSENRSSLKKVHFTAPFKVISPFYDERERMQVMIISVSAGIMAGDRQKIDIFVDKDARAEIISQSFEKIHKMEDSGHAKRETNLSVAKGGILLYSPLPTIPFAGSAFESNTSIELEDDTARLFFSEIIACGRATRGERFDYRYYKSLTSIRKSGKLIYSDNSVYIPDETDMEGFCMFEGYSHLSNLLLVNIELTDNLMELIEQEILALPDCIGGMTKIGSGDLCIKVLSNGSEPLIMLHDMIKLILDL